MRTTMLLSLLLLAGSISTAYAQITITEADVQNRVGQQTTTTTYDAVTLNGLQAVAALKGGNQTFDIRSAAFDAGESFTIELISCSADLPGCADPAFATANFIVREVHQSTAGDSMAISFARLASDGFFLLGSAARGDFDDTNPGMENAVFTFNPAFQAEKLPLTMGMNWTTSVTLESSFSPFAPRLDDTFDVDAWGTLMTPAGSAPALKMTNRTISTISFAGFTLIDTTFTISFLTKTDLSASIDLDAQGAVIGASYSKGADPGTATETGPEVPTAIALEQNYPNPFNPSTTIPFTLHEAGRVQLTIYDLLGREVAVLVNEMRPAGAYEATWQPGDLPSGVYLYRLSLDDASLVHPLTLLK